MTPHDLGGSLIYSNLCVDRETDDVDGLRVIVRPFYARPRVLGQYAEGGLPELQAAKSREVDGGLEVEVSGDAPEVEFTGKIQGDNALFRSRAPHAQPFHLKRVRDLRHAPYCDQAG
jgi:hypothetical protein